MLKLVFMGSPAFAVPTLAEILAAGHEVVAVYSQPPKRAGRGLAETSSPVHAFAAEAGLPVHTPRTLKTEDAQAVFRAFAPDVCVVVGYGMILPQAILDVPRHGCLNLHPSLLPRWRGAAPVQRPIMAGDQQTAAVIMRMEAGLDTGPMCLAERVPIGPDMTAGDLHDVLKLLGAGLMVRALAALERGSLKVTAQSVEGVTYAPKITNEECRIDFTRDAHSVWNQIRGLSPTPGAFFELEIDGKHERFKVLRAVPLAGPRSAVPGALLNTHFVFSCGSGTIQLTEVQRAGKKAMSTADMLRGLAVKPGMVAQ